MWIINGKIYTMAGKVYENGYVRIKGKIIDAVGPMEQAAELGLPDLGRPEGGRERLPVREACLLYPAGRDGQFRIKREGILQRRNMRKRTGCTWRMGTSRSDRSTRAYRPHGREERDHRG